MRGEFTDFCRNKDNQLVIFYNKMCQDFENKQYEHLNVEQEEQMDETEER